MLAKPARPRGPRRAAGRRAGAGGPAARGGVAAGGGGRRWRSGWRVGSVEVSGELGDAPAVVQQCLQAGAQVGEAQACGLLVEVAVAATLDREATVEDQAARQTGCWGCFPCARRAGSPAAPGETRPSGHHWSRRSRGQGRPSAWATPRAARVFTL